MNRPEIIKSQHEAPNLIPIDESLPYLEAQGIINKKAKDFNPKKEADDHGPTWTK